MAIFHKGKAVGSFAGFSGSGLEFHADIIVPYESELQNIPLHGEFVLVQLSDDTEALLGRITSVQAHGRLTTGIGEEFAVRQVQEEREISDDIRKRFLRYKVDVRILGVLRERGRGLSFVASHRRVPHVGAKVAFLDADTLRFVVDAEPRPQHEPLPSARVDAVAANDQEIGFYALGEYVWAGADARLSRQDWMTVKSPDLAVRFPTGNLVSRRAVVFARAGFGKSNLMKQLLAATYAQTPEVLYTAGTVPVGTLVFDPEGEYFWADSQGRPGLSAIPHLRETLVVFTDRHTTDPEEARFKVGGVKLNLADVAPRLVFSLLQPDDGSANHDQLTRLEPSEWGEIIDEWEARGYRGALEAIQALNVYQGTAQQQRESAGARKVDAVLAAFHDGSSQTRQQLRTALRSGKLCIVDVSRLSGSTGFRLSALILAQLFEENQNAFTDPASPANPIIAVLEEAQSVLGGQSGDDNPFVEWTKEGRKYGLGSILVTQQPGSLPQEILSQADNFFVFHLLSENDLRTLKSANAHFSDDLLSSLLNEPIPGNGVIWSSAAQRPYPVSVRVMNFAEVAASYRASASEDLGLGTYAEALKGQTFTTEAERHQTFDRLVLDHVRANCLAQLRGGQPGILVSSIAGKLMSQIESALPHIHPDERLRTGMKSVVAAARHLAVDEGRECIYKKIDEGQGRKRFHAWFA